MIEIPPSDKPTLIVVEQIDLRGDKSRLGFDAPPEVLIFRKELWLSVLRDRENAAAAAVAKPVED